MIIQFSKILRNKLDGKTLAYRELKVVDQIETRFDAFDTMNHYNKDSVEVVGC